MELNLRTVLVILGCIIMLGILVDGFRRMHRARKDALNIDVKGDFKFPEDSFPSELPNGGGRVIADVNAEDLLKDAQQFRDQLDDLPVMSALDSLEENAEKTLDENIKISMHDDRTYSGEPEFQQKSYSESGTSSSFQSDNSAFDQYYPKESLATSSAQGALESLGQSDLINSDQMDDVTSSNTAFAEVVTENAEDKNVSSIEANITQKDTERLAPKASPLNLDQHVPLLTDVEELGEDIEAHDAVSPATNTEDSIELTLNDVESIKAVVDDISELLSPSNELNEPQEHTDTNDDDDDDDQSVHELMAQAAYAPVKQPGPNAEVLSERPAPSLVLVTHVVPHDEDGFCGEDILYLVNSCDLRHGEKGIFHRFEQEGGEGCIEFSMANSFNPGTFDPNTLMHERIHGISLFMSLPGPLKAMNAFESMTEMASVIARNLGGDVHDETHSIMALQTIEHNRQLVRDFVRKQKLTELK